MKFVNVEIDRESWLRLEEETRECVKICLCKCAVVCVREEEANEDKEEKKVTLV